MQEERIRVLRMVRLGRISLDEATRLLNALSGAPDGGAVRRGALRESPCEARGRPGKA